MRDGYWWWSLLKWSSHVLTVAQMNSAVDESNHDDDDDERFDWWRTLGDWTRCSSACTLNEEHQITNCLKESPRFGARMKNMFGPNHSKPQSLCVFFLLLQARNPLPSVLLIVVLTKD